MPVDDNRRRAQMRVRCRRPSCCNLAPPCCALARLSCEMRPSALLPLSRLDPACAHIVKLCVEVSCSRTYWVANTRGMRHGSGQKGRPPAAPPPPRSTAWPKLLRKGELCGSRLCMLSFLACNLPRAQQRRVWRVASAYKRYASSSPLRPPSIAAARLWSARAAVSAPAPAPTGCSGGAARRRQRRRQQAGSCFGTSEWAGDCLQAC